MVAGGLLKNPVVMQIYADVLRRPLHLIGSEQGPALGPRDPRRGRRRASTPTSTPRPTRWGAQERDAYVPDERRAPTPTTPLYATTSRLHDHFGRGGDDVMHRLRRPRTRRARP